MSNFNEKDHPRDRDGKFTNANGGSGSDDVKEQIAWARKNGKELPLNADGSLDTFKLGKMYAERDKSRNHVDSDNNKNSLRGKGESYEEFFGEEFKGLKGAAAIEKLLKEKRGHVKNAFERPEIGSIDLVWGNEKGGLLHTIQKRDKLFAKGIGHISGLDMVRKIPEIIEKGKFNTEDGRINIDYDGYRVGIMPAFFDNKINWIVTAMEKWQ